MCSSIIAIVIYFTFTAYGNQTRDVPQSIDPIPVNESVADSGGDPGEIGHTQSDGESKKLLFDETYLKLGEAWNYYDIIIVLQKIQYNPVPILFWSIKNRTGELISISPDFINKITILDEYGGTYLSESSSCNITPECTKSGLDLPSQATIQITNTINIDESRTSCQTLSVIKSSVNLKFTRGWLIKINC